MKARFIPLIFFILLASAMAAFLLSGKEPGAAPSALIGKPAPASVSAMKGKPYLVNFFASWCVPCALEQPVFLRFKNEQSITVLGVLYKDSSIAAKIFLKTHGDPFDSVLEDKSGRVAIDWGVSGVPETFVVDRSGIVIYRHTGPLDDEKMKNDILPLLRGGG